MSAAAGPPRFSRREREIMQILYRLGEGAVAEVHALVADDTSYDSVRLTLGALEEKGHVTYRREGRRYVYTPTVPLKTASRSAIRDLTRTYFRGSPHRAVIALLDSSSERLTDEELDEIAEWIRRAKEEAR